MTNRGESDFDDSAIVPLTARRDLQVTSLADGRRTIKDPISLQYYRLSPEEYSVFSMLDGCSTFGQMTQKFQTQFPGSVFSIETVNVFLQDLLSNGLVTAPLAGLGRSLAVQSQSRQTSGRIAAFLNPLSIRISGFDPERLLRRFDGLIATVFSPVVILGCLVLIVVALAATVLRFDVLTARLPQLSSIVNPGHLLLCGLVFVLIKIFHELAHAAACRHFGGECHDMGVLFILCMPLFYCDVSDAWMIENRWKRIAISAAGIGLELVVAAVATLLWWWSVGGPLHDLFLSVMLVCSVNTVLFNGNPLLRYDGYHVLADLVDIPNLSAQSQNVAWATFDSLVLGQSTPATSYHSTGRYCFLLAYAVASSLYRVLVVAGIGWFVLNVATQMELTLIGVLLVVPLAASLIVPFVRSVTGRFRSIVRQDSDRRWRSTVGMIALGLTVVAVLFWPFPHSVVSPFVIVPGDADAVHARVPGRLHHALNVGSSVREGQTVATLMNVNVALQKSAADAKVIQLSRRVEHLEAIRSVDDAASLQWPIAKDALSGAKQQLARLSIQNSGLAVTSGRAGTILPARTSSDSSGERQSLWSQDVDEHRNHGRWIAESEILCYVGDPNRIAANVLVGDANIEFLKVGQQVTLVTQSAPGQTLRGTIREISSLATSDVPPELVVVGLMAAPNPASGNSESQWQVTVEIDDDARSCRLYSPGQARIHCGRMNLAQRIIETIRRTFATDL